MMNLRHPGGGGLALGMLMVVLGLVWPAAPVKAQVLHAAWILPAGYLQVAGELLMDTSPTTCDSQALLQGHHDYVSCVAREALAQVVAGSLTIAEGRALLRRAVSARTGSHMPTRVTRDRP